MSDCHSTTLVQRTTNAVQQYLAAQEKGVLPGTCMPPEPRGVGLGHAVHQLLRPMRFDVGRSRVLDELVCNVGAGCNSNGKPVVLGTIMQIAADPAGYGAVYEGLTDDESRRTFDWFIAYRAALAFLGEEADDVLGHIASTAWREPPEQASRRFAGNAYHVEGASVDSGLPEVGATFFSGQY